ncbi:DUF6796 family protein [Butyrivibrio fibrisolvens]|nr:DUF6796 family protein [Butyrivibrio fibrisolvens]
MDIVKRRKGRSYHVLAALLGMIGITVETMCFFAIYRVIAAVSDKYAHAYRAGLIGMLVFGPFCHVMCCATIYYHNAVVRMNPQMAVEETLRLQTERFEEEERWKS